MNSSRTISIVAIFTSLVIASDYAMGPLPNVKLVDTLVFSSAYAFGFRIGAAIAVFSEFVWSFVSPYGIAGYITPFLVIGELLFVLTGYAASKVWGKPQRLRSFSLQNSFFGAILAICAFVWDFETNIATGLLTGAHSLTVLLGFELAGIPFMIPHELGDFMLGTLLAPVIIMYFSRAFQPQNALKVAAEVSAPRTEAN